MQKAWEDKTFKKELIADPINTIEKLTGKRINLPKGKTLVVKDQTDETVVYINIPAKLNLDDVELNEEQLEAVAGGADSPFTYAMYVYIMTVLGGDINGNPS